MTVVIKLNRLGKIISAEKYCKRIIFSVYDIWRNFNFWLFSVDLNWRFILMNFDLADGYDRQRGKKEYIAKCNTFTVLVYN